MDAALAPWEELSEEFRESCRRQADHIGTKLEAVGCGIGLLTDWAAELLAFTDAEVERMARMEHERWMDERRRQRWRYGEVRDLERRTNPHLVPWQDLPEPMKEVNRAMVRGIPALLAGAGLRAYRPEPGDATSGGTASPGSPADSGIRSV
jgi:hypothetical protein